MTLVKQSVANSPLSSYPVGVFKTSEGAELQAMVLVDSVGEETTAANPLPVSVVSGSGDATAANQTLEIAQLAVIQSLQSTLQELVSRLDDISACKYHLAEALRVQIVGSVGLSTSNSSSLDITPVQTYVSPPYARYLQIVAEQEIAVTLSNINNVSI